MSEAFDYSHTKEVKTCCKLCLNGCGIIVSINEKGIKIKGDPEHPLSKGFLCLKGLSSLKIGDLPQRILYPIKRKGARGGGEWERITYEEAINDISSKLKDVIRKYGSEAICVQSLPPKDVAIWYAFASALETPNFFRHDHHVCFTPILVADLVTFGNLLLYLNLSHEDTNMTKTIVLWGINPPETNPAKWRIIERARDNGAKLIVIDPRPTRAAKEADLWLRVRPGKDLALAFGILNVIIHGHMYDRNFVEKWTYGFDKLKNRVAPYTPQTVSKITNVDERLITQTATLIAKNKPSSIFTFMGLVMSGNSINTLRSLGIILAVTGNVDIKGGNLIKIPPKTEKITISKDILKKQISSDKFPLLSGPNSLVAGILPSPNPYDVIEAMINERPYPVKALITDCNPLTALEDSKKVLKAFMKLELIVVLELFRTPTAEFADYVLPITWFYESNGIAEYSGMNFIAARRRVIKPKGEAKEEGEILIDIMRSLGILNKLPFKTYDEYLDYRLSPQNMSFSEFAERGYIVSPVIEKKYEKGLLREDEKDGFNTPTGKVEIYSTILEKYGYDPLPVEMDPPEELQVSPEVSKEYPFILITGVRKFAHYHGLGVQIPEFRRIDPYPTVEISAETAQKLCLKEGEEVVIEVPRKDERIYRKVKIVEELHPEVISLPGHWYLPDEERQEKRIWNVHMNLLTDLRDDYDPVVGGSGCRVIPARIRKI